MYTISDLFSVICKSTCPTSLRAQPMIICLIDGWIDLQVWMCHMLASCQWNQCQTFWSWWVTCTAWITPDWLLDYCIDWLTGVNVPHARFLPVKTTSDMLIMISNLYSLTYGWLIEWLLYWLIDRYHCVTCSLLAGEDDVRPVDHDE